MENDLKMYETMLKISESNLRASEILYMYNQYSESIFLFQQSVEKANKFFGCALNIISEDEMKSIGHDPTRSVDKSTNRILDNYQIINEALTSAGVAPLSEKDIELLGIETLIEQSSDLLVRLKDYRKNKQNLVYLSSNDIKDAFGGVDAYCIALKKKEFDYVNFKKTLLFVVERFASLNPSFYLDKAQIENITPENFPIDTINKIRDVLVDHLRLYLYLFFLGLIMLPHSEISRYPGVMKEESPLTYSKRMPIVKHLNFLFKKQKYCLKYLKKTIKTKKTN